MEPEPTEPSTVVATHTTPELPGPEIVKALIEAGLEVGPVEKDRKADPKMGGYPFRSYDGVVLATREALFKVGIIPWCVDLRISILDKGQTSSGAPRWLWQLDLLITLIHSESMTRWATPITTASWGDDAKALGAARSYALREVISRALLLAGGGAEDVEARTEHVYKPPNADDLPVPSRKVYNRFIELPGPWQFAVLDRIKKDSGLDESIMFFVKPKWRERTEKLLAAAEAKVEAGEPAPGAEQPSEPETGELPEPMPWDANAVTLMLNNGNATSIKTWLGEWFDPDNTTRLRLLADRTDGRPSLMVDAVIGLEENGKNRSGLIGHLTKIRDELEMLEIEGEQQPTEPEPASETETTEAETEEPTEPAVEQPTEPPPTQESNDDQTGDG